MNRAEFERIAQEAEALSTRDPIAYERKLLGMVRRGKLALAGALVLCLVSVGIGAAVVAIGAFAGIWIILVFGSLAIVILRAYATRFPPPKGYLVTKGEAPELWTMAEELRLSLDSPKLTGIVLQFVDNAAAVESRGIFGLRGFHLILGTLRLASITPEELKALVAHELAHHTQRDGSRSIHIARTTHAWQVALAQHQSTSLFHRAFRKFTDGYLPALEAMRLVQSRRAEEAADSLSGMAASNEAAVRMLARPRVTESSAYKAVYPTALLDETVNPTDFYARVIAIARAQPRDEILQALRAEIDAETTFMDTHPRLTDRLRNLGVPDPHDEQWQKTMTAELADPGRVVALEWIFGDQATQKLTKMGEDIKSVVDEGRKEITGDLDSLREEFGDPKTWEPFHFVMFAEYCRHLQPDLAETHLALGLQKYPDHPRLLVTSARLISDRDPAAALAILDHIGDRDPWRAGYRMTLRQACLEALGRLQEAYDVSWRWEDTESKQMQELYDQLLDMNHARDLYPIEADAEARRGATRLTKDYKYRGVAVALERRLPEIDTTAKFVFFLLDIPPFRLDGEVTQKFYDKLIEVPELAESNEWFGVVLMKNTPIHNHILARDYMPFLRFGPGKS